MDYKNILFELKNSIATITFNRPKALNALNSELLDELSTLLNTILANEEVRVLILTGAGEKSFVAGADIKEIATLSPVQAKHFSIKGQQIITTLQRIPIPVIAAVNGFALGGGCEIALACDFIYASANAKFGLPEINLGLIPGFGGTQRLPKLIGLNLAKEMIFTGKMLTASEALAARLVNKVVDPPALMAEVMKTAAIMASKGKVSLYTAKQTVNKGLTLDIESGCEMESSAFALCMASEDAKEGTAAFIEKREPVFKGSLKGE